MKMICHCLDVTEKEIIAAVKKGSTTLEQVQEATSAGTVCGGCVGEIERIIKNHSGTK